MELAARSYTERLAIFSSHGLDYHLRERIGHAAILRGRVLADLACVDRAAGDEFRHVGVGGVAAFRAEGWHRIKCSMRLVGLHVSM